MGERDQYDDHIWLTIRGQAWAIRRIERPGDKVFLYLWRGYEPHLDYCTMDVTHMRWSAYCQAAISQLERNYVR